MPNLEPLFICRNIKESDLNQISMIENDAFPDLFPQTQFQKEIKKAHSTILVSELNEYHPKYQRLMPENKKVQYRNGYTGWVKGNKFLTGFILYRELFDGIHIISIGVRREYTKIKIGTLLLSECISRVIDKSFDKIILEVRPSNKAAINLYKNFGFEIIGEKKKFYSDNHEDALIMSLCKIMNDDYRKKIKTL